MSIGLITRALLHQNLGTFLKQRNSLIVSRWKSSRPHKVFESKKIVSRIISPLNQEEYNIRDAPPVPDDFRHVYPDFIPNIIIRNRFCEKLEREDMLARRSVLDIPEFYPGSILAVTVSDPNASGKTNRFVGICLSRGGSGLRAWFNLRNVVDNIGVEILYEMYCPLILSIELLRLEKRLDDNLTYLRDCLPEFSTFPFDMDPEPLPDSVPVPVNPLMAKLKPKPWRARWERMNLQGVEEVRLPVKFAHRTKLRETPWEKYDLMKEYRATIPEEEQASIYRELMPFMPKLEAVRRRVKRVRLHKDKME